MLEIDNMAIEKPLGFILKILRIMDDGAVNVVKSFVGDPAGITSILVKLKGGSMSFPICLPMTLRRKTGCF